MLSVSPSNTFFRDYKINFQTVVKETLNRVYYTGQECLTGNSILCCKISLQVCKTFYRQKIESAVRNEMRIQFLECQFVLPLHKVFRLTHCYIFIYTHPQCVSVPTFFPANKYHQTNRIGDLIKLCKFILHCIQAIVYLHSKQIIHGNISPHNIVINDNGLPQLLNFTDCSWIPAPQSTPLQKPLPVKEKENSIFLCDNCAFFAPELCANKLHYTKTIDVYALGHTILSILLGKYTHRNNLTCVGKQMKILKLYKQFFLSNKQRTKCILELEYDKYCPATTEHTATEQIYAVLNLFPNFFRSCIEDCLEVQKYRITSKQLLCKYRPLFENLIRSNTSPFYTTKN